MRICEFGDCNEKAVKVYKGYFKYHFCYNHYRVVYDYFCEFIHTIHHWRCADCGEELPLFVHHKVFKSQGGRNIIEHVESLCLVCHNKAHGIKMIKY